MADRKLDSVTTWVDKNRTWLVPAMVVTAGVSAVAVARSVKEEEPQEPTGKILEKEALSDVGGRVLFMAVGTGAVVGAMAYLSRPKGV